MGYMTYAAFLLLAIALSAPSFAFIMTVPEETVSVPIGTSKQVDIRIDSGKLDEISFTVLDAKPWITQSDSMLSVSDDRSRYLSLFITPFKDTAPSVYRFTIIAESLKTGEQQKKFIFISVSKLDILEIDSIELAGNFTPTGQASITITLTNYKPTTAKDIKVVSSISSPSSKLIEFEQNIDSIDSERRKNISYSFTIPQQSEPGLYSVNVTAASGGETRSKLRTFSVASQARFVQNSGTRPQIFGFSKYIEVTNIGNAKDDAVVSDSLSPFEAAFYSGETPLSTTDSVFTWVLNDITPGETRTLEYSINYTSLFLFIVVILLAGWLFFFKIRTLRIKKYLLEKKFIEEGEEFTVGVELMNATGRKIDDLTVKDFVPSVFNVKDGEGPKPSKKRTAAGMELAWKLKDLHKNEERILSYKLLPIFGVHGTIRLPQATAGYQNRKKMLEMRSPYTNIGIETENYGDRKGVFKRKK